MTDTRALRLAAAQGIAALPPLNRGYARTMARGPAAGRVFLVTADKVAGEVPHDPAPLGYEWVDTEIADDATVIEVDGGDPAVIAVPWS